MKNHAEGPIPRPDYDVIVVGGRVAGASLAIRLGARGVRVLVLDRASFPSLPQVPSSPIIHPGTMQLLDELGIDEAAYANDHSRMPRFVFEFGSWFHAVMDVPEMHGRAWMYGVDRDRFDALIRDRLHGLPSVTIYDRANLVGLVRDTDGTVGGVVIREGNGRETRISSRCIVGADGRYSAVARLAAAPVVEEEATHVSTVYYADWEGVAPFAPGLHGGYIHATGRGLDVLFFAMPDGRFSINTHERADRVDVAGDATGYYEGVLRRLPAVARRIEGARRVSDVIGIKRIGNGYRMASGAGWVLVGDALHYKDPVDGQGIYDALISTRLLDEALARWLGGEPWQHAMADYDAAVHVETHSMYLATCGRLRRELYSEPPVPIIRTLIRWQMTDPAYQDRFLRLLGRDVDPARWLPAAVARGAVLRGIGRDLTRSGRRTAR